MVFRAARVKIELWRNGFIVEHDGERGPFRPKDDPSNKRFLADVARQQMPSEIAALVGDDAGEETVMLVDKSGQDFKVPPKKFSGALWYSLFNIEHWNS